MPSSHLEAHLALLIRAHGLPAPEREFAFAAPERRFRWDFAWPVHRLALEVQGGVWAGGRHTRGGGFTQDCAKLSEGAARGWRCVAATPEHIQSGEAIDWLRRALAYPEGAA